MARPPPGFKGVGNLKPTAIPTYAVIFAHACTLTFVANSGFTIWRTDFLLAKRLYYVEPPISPDSSSYEVVKPRFWGLPTRFVPDPSWLITSTITQPIAIGLVEWQTDTQQLSLTAPTKDDWSVLLIPNSL